MFDNLRKSPFARLLIFFIGGIYTAILAGYNNGNQKIFLAAIVFATLIIIFLLLCHNPGFHTNWMAGIIGAAIIYVTGFIIMNIHYSAGQNSRLQGEFNGNALLEIRDPAVETEQSVKTFAKIRYRIAMGKVVPTKQKILVYFEKDSFALKLAPGDLIIASIRITEVNAPKNPGEFDYRAYLSARSVYHQAYLAHGKWQKTEITASWTVNARAYKMQQKLLKQYQKIGLNNTLYSILSALTLGYKSDIDSHTRQVFSQAGVMHVMALSGFNVGVIAAVLTYFLVFCSFFHYGETIKVIIIISVIWLFVFVTGLSASVTRAAVMITLVLAGRLIHRKINSINILAFSAFILLSFSPALITDISFQLSFAAVFGIIVYYPLLYKIIRFKFYIFDKLWQLFTLSCAAQLATLPFTLFYFHQFPVYFWLTNLYVVPLVSIIICIAGIYLMLSFISPLSFILGQLLAFLLEILYKSVSFVEILPYSLIDNIGITRLQVLILILIIFVLALALIYRRIYFFSLSLLLIIFFQITSISKTVTNRNQKIFLVANCRNRSVINLIDGKSSIIYGVDNLSINDPALQYSLRNFWISHGIKNNHRIVEQAGYKASWLGENTLVNFKGKKILLLSDAELLNFHCDKSLKIDIMVAGRGFKPVTKSIFRFIRPSEIILDCSLNHYQAEKWEHLCSQNGIKCWNVRDKGAFCVY